MRLHLAASFSCALALAGCDLIRGGRAPVSPKAASALAGSEGRPEDVDAPHGDHAQRDGADHRDDAHGASPVPPATPAWASPHDDPTLPFRAAMPLVSDPPSTRYATLSPSACRKELERRKLPFSRSKQAAGGVATALRPTGAVAGVRLAIPRAPSPYGIVDCRLALVLDDFAQLAAEHGVVELRIDNTYRPKAKLPTKGKKPSQHAYGLAADIVSFTFPDGRVLRIETDWHAPLGGRPCGPGAVMEDPTPNAIALRNLVCEAARRSLFHHMLSPSFDAAHRDHLHADIKRGTDRQPMR